MDCLGAKIGQKSYNLFILFRKLCSGIVQKTNSISLFMWGSYYLLWVFLGYCDLNCIRGNLARQEFLVAGLDIRFPAQLSWLHMTWSHVSMYIYLVVSGNDISHIMCHQRGELLGFRYLFLLVCLSNVLRQWYTVSHNVPSKEPSNGKFYISSCLG